MDEELRKADERLVEQTKKQLELWRRVAAVDGDTGYGIDPALDKDHTVVSINLNGVVVGPEDRLVLTLQPDYENSTIELEAIRQSLINCGISPDRVVLLWGFDAAVVKPPAHPPEQASVSEQLGSTGPWCNTTQRAVEQSDYKVNDPLPIPPGYHVKSERIGNTNGLLISYEEDTLEQVAAQSVGKPFKDQKGNVLGTVERAWVENGKVYSSVKWDPVVPGDPLLVRLPGFSEKVVKPGEGDQSPPPPELTKPLVEGQFAGDFKLMKTDDPPAGPGNAIVVTKEEWNNLMGWCDPAAKAQTDRIEKMILDETPPEQKKDGIDAGAEYYQDPTVTHNTPPFPPRPTPEPPRQCGYCNGTGKMISREHTKPPQNCPVCGGRGSR